MKWLVVSNLSEIPVLGSRVVSYGGKNIAVFRNKKDEVFAVNDRCPHKGGPLSQGIVFGNRVACPLHNWVIDLSQGTAVAPDEGCVHRYDTRVENGQVHLLIGENNE